MKKSIVFFAAAIVLCLAVSCASSSGGTAMSQEQANQAFEKVYSAYRSHIILEGAKDYTVVKGDTLSSITRTAYGAQNGYYFPLIMLASSDVVLDPDLIEPGMKLVIPDLDRNLKSADAKSKMKAFFMDIAGVYDKKGKTGDDVTRDRLMSLANSL